MRDYSVIDKSFELTNERWLITLMNTVTGLAGLLGGHNAILVEGMQNGALFVRQCDIQAMPFKGEMNGSTGAPIQDVRGVISDIRIFETYYEDKSKYGTFSKRSWPVTQTEAKAMLKSIDDDKNTTEVAKRDEGPYLFYRFSGRYKIRLFVSEDKCDGDNCATWCIEKLKVANIQIPLAPLDGLRAAPSKHVKPGADVAESIQCRIL